MNRNISMIFIIFLLLPTIGYSVEYEVVSFVDDGIQVDVQLLDDTPWYSPFSGTVDVTLGIIPLDENVTQVNVTEIVLSIHKKDTSGNTLSLLAAEPVELSPIAQGTIVANVSEAVLIDGEATGIECYFGLTITGSYSNGSDVIAFEITSPEDLVGPFSINTGITSPTALAGIFVSVIAAVILGAGFHLARKNVKPTKGRRKLLVD